MKRNFAFPQTYFSYPYIRSYSSQKGLAMRTGLSPELRALCERASREKDPKKLLELTKQINEKLDQQNLKVTPKIPGKAAPNTE